MGESWSRAEALRRVQRNVWRYLQSSAAQENTAGAAEALFDLERGQLRRLAAAHVGLDPRTDLMLDEVELVLKELPSVVVRNELELVGAVRGPVVWARTRERQRVTGDRTRFICRPPDRRYDTPLARLVHLALRQCSALGTQAALDAAGPLGSRIHSHVERAHHLLRHVKLADVTPVDAMSERSLLALNRYRHTASVIEFVRRYREAVEQLDPGAVEAIVNERILAPLTDDRLFELVVGFEIAAHLKRLGYVETVDLLAADRPFARFSGEHELTIYWQRPTWRLYPALKSGSRYGATLVGNGMTQGLLRPDLVLVAGTARRPLLIEVKQTAGAFDAPERGGVREMMAYLHDARDLFAQVDYPHGLVVGWNAAAQPGLAEIVVSDQGQVGQAVDVFLSTVSD